MQKLLYLVMFSGPFSACMLAQDHAMDVFLGYSFVHASANQGIPSFNADGGIGTFAFNINNNLAVEAEFGGYHNGNIGGTQLDTTSATYLFGPRFSYGHNKRLNPYIHVLFGGRYATTSIAATSVLIPVPNTGPVSSERYTASQTNLAMAAGGGLDFRLSHSVTLRVFQVDYFLTRFEAPSVLNPAGQMQNRAQNDLRFAIGVAFNFGEE